MTRLLASEVRRLAGRRLVFWTLVVTLALLVLVLVIVVSRSSPGTDDVMRTTQLWLTESGAEARRVNRDNAIATISVLTYLPIIVIAASAVGAEYRAGTVTTILTWEPRRIRLLVARLAAAAIVAMALFLVVHLVFIGGWTLGAELNGRSSGADEAFWRSLFAVVGRATLVAGVLAVISGAIATIGKNTAAAMGVWFGYLIVIEAILRSQIDDFVPWFLTANIGAVYGWESVTQNGQTATPEAATLRLALYVVLFGGAAVAIFQRRDVT